VSKITVEEFMDNHESPDELNRYRSMTAQDHVEGFVDENTRFHIIRTSENYRPAQLDKLNDSLDSQCYMLEKIESIVEDWEAKAVRTKDADHIEFVNQPDYELEARLMRAQLDVAKARFAENFSMLRRLKEESE